MSRYLLSPAPLSRLLNRTQSPPKPQAGKSKWVLLYGTLGWVNCCGGRLRSMDCHPAPFDMIIQTLHDLLYMYIYIYTYTYVYSANIMRMLSVYEVMQDCIMNHQKYQWVLVCPLKVVLLGRVPQYGAM